MKYPFVIIMILSFAALPYSCKHRNHAYIPTKTMVEGQITSADSLPVTLVGLEEIKTQLDKEGRFSINAELEESGIYNLIIGDETIHIFIVPGDKIILKGDYTILTNTTFEGSHSIENNYLSQFSKLRNETIPEDYELFYTQDELKVLSSIDERTQIFITDQQDYQKKNGPFDETFGELLSAEIAFDAASMKMNFPEYYHYFRPDSNLLLSDTYDSFFQNLDTDNEMNLLVPSFKEFSGLYVDYKTKEDTTLSEQPLIVRKFDNIFQLFKNQEVRNVVAHQLMSSTIDQSINDASLIIDNYQAKQTNKSLLQKDQENYLSWNALTKGKSAPDFEYKTPKGLKVSLSSLQGKVVYIDVWATWCGPCMKELPSLEKLQAQFKSESNMAFVSISVDTDKNAWESTIKQKNMQGVQLIADSDWNSKIVHDYKIAGIPRFIVIGKDGNIIDANAPRPSSAEIANILSAALKG